MSAPKTRQVTVTLPEELACEAERRGLLADARIAATIRRAIADDEAWDELARLRDSGAFGLPMTVEEIQEEVRAVRAERRGNAGSS